MRRNKLHALLAGVATLAACGEVASVNDLSGRWKLTVPHALGECDLSDDLPSDAAGSLAGTVALADAVWSVTGTADANGAILLYILPAHDEDALLAALGFDGTTASGISKWRPAHAADRVTLRGVVGRDGNEIVGTATTVFLPGEAAFSLKR